MITEQWQHNNSMVTQMGVDLVSYTLGIIATIIGSTTVAYFAQWIQTRSRNKNVKKSLLSEIEHNYSLVMSLVGKRTDYISEHWSYANMSLSKASFESAKQSGFLYTLKPEFYEKISKAYDIIYLIEKRGYHPQGTAGITFVKLNELLGELVKDYILKGH